MTFKFIAVYVLVAVIATVAGAPYHHGDDGGNNEHHEHHEHHEHEEHSGGSSHQSFHLVSHGGDDHEHHHEHDHDHDDGHAEYHFKYGVEDKKTGDIKGQSEKRNGHMVEGHYELIDADGHKRTVHYVADKHLGFVAHVHRTPTHHKVDEPKHTFYGGHAHFEESHDESHGDHHGHEVHKHGYSLKQEHAKIFHHEHGHH